MKSFCFWDAKSLTDTCIVMFNLLVTIVLFFMSVFNIIKSIKFLQGKIIRIYILIILWCLFTICQFSYSIIIYFGYLEKSNKKQIPEWSKAYCLIDAIPGFIIQSLFLCICYIMLSNIRQIAFSFQLKLNFMIKSGFTMFRVYLILRILAYLTAYLITVFANPFNDQIKYANYSKILVLLTDSLISSLILVACFKTISGTLDQVQIIEADEQKFKLKIEYGMMIAASSVRFATDLFFLLYLPTSGGIDESYCIDPFSDHLKFSIGYLIFGNLLGHFIPIALILKFYQFKKNQNQPESLVDKEKQQY